MIEEAILDAERRGTKVLSLGLMNQAYGALYINKHPNLNVKVVDGSTLSVAIVLNTIPKGTTQVLLRGTHNKVASAIAFNLCQKGIQVSFFPHFNFFNNYLINENTMLGEWSY